MLKFTQGPATKKCSKCGETLAIAAFSKANFYCKICASKSMKEWRKANPENARAQRRKWNESEVGRAYLKKHKREKQRRNPDTCRRAWNRRQEWLRSGNVTGAQLRELYDAAMGACDYCGVEVHPRFSPQDPRGFDHIQPRVLGGSHTITNMVLCCAKCNAMKSSQTRAEFVEAKHR